MKKLLLCIPLIIVLSGCFGRTKVLIVQENNTPMQVVQETSIKVRCVDPVTQDIEEADKVVTGYFVLSPSLYNKLVKTAAQVVPATEKK